MKIFPKISIVLIFISTVSWASESAKASVEVLAKSTASWDGTELHSYGAGKPEVTVLRIKIPPKLRLPWHKHPVINAGVMLKGELKVVTRDNKILYLKPGDTIIEVLDKWHYGINEGDETVEIIVFYAGLVGQSLSILEQ